MIDTIPQKPFRPITSNKRITLPLPNKTGNLNTNDDAQSFIWLNLHVSELASTEESNEILRGLFQKESATDTNNNTNNSIAFEMLNNDIHDISDYCALSSKCQGSIEVENNNETNSIIQLSSNVAPNQESNAVNCTSSKKEEKEGSVVTDCVGHKSRPLTIHPILKYPKNIDIGSSSDIVLEERRHKTHKSQCPNNSNKATPSVSFLLPSDLYSTESDTIDNKIMSKRNMLKSTEKAVIKTPNKVISLDAPKSRGHNKISPTAKLSLRLSPPSSFSDSDISDYETPPIKTNMVTRTIDEMMKPPINVEEGGRYSILNPDFSPKSIEDSIRMTEIETMRSEIVSQKNKCLLGVINWDCSVKTVVSEKIFQPNPDNDEDSSGESTDTLLEEARQYLVLAKEKFVTVDDWKTIEQNKKKYRKKVNRVT